MSVARSALRPLLVALLIAVAVLLVTWIVGPRSPSRFFRTTLLIALGGWAAVLAVPPTRRVANRLLDRVLRPVAAATTVAIASFALAEVALRVVASASMCTHAPARTPTKGPASTQERDTS